MKNKSLRTLALPCVLATLMLYGARAHAANVGFSGRGVFHFASASGCPPGGVDSAQANCNRIALDQAGARATLDTDNHAIEFVSDANQRHETVIGDVLLQGSGTSEQGQRVPLSLHILLRRDGSKWDLDSYIHAPVGGRFSDVALDPYQISVRDGARRRVLLSAEHARRMFARPSLTRRLARAFVDVQAADPAHPDKGGIMVTLGVGKLSTAVLRAAFAPELPVAPASLDQAFQNGEWSIQLQALSNHIPAWVVQRELFLFGLEAHPALQPSRGAGFRQRDTLTFGAHEGKGFLRFNDQQGPFDGADAAGHAFMQESFMGLILGWRRTQPDSAVMRTAAVTQAPQR